VYRLPGFERNHYQESLYDSRIDDLLDAVSGSKYVTSLDLTSGYHQILISEEDRPKTAFCTLFGHFQFKVFIEGLPQVHSALPNAPATF
jgi:hypothetical protein